MHLTEEHRPLRRLRHTLTLTAAAVFTLTAWSTALADRVNVASADATAAEAPAPHIPRVSSAVMAGNLLTHVNPIYPRAAKSAKMQGSVVLRAVIAKDGTVGDLQVMSGPAEFRASALDAVHQWTYKPYVLNGEPTAVETTITVNYTLQP